MTGARMRAPLDVPPGPSTVSLCNLVPGQVYLLIATGAVYGQTQRLTLTPTNALRSAAGDLSALPGKTNAWRFTAPAECVAWQIDAGSSEGLASVPLFLSVQCESCAETGSWTQDFLNSVGATNLQVASGYSAQNLVTNTLVGGDCYEVANVSAFGNATSRGIFSNGTSSIDLSNGIVMCTGNVSVLPGPNDEDNADGGYINNSPDDPDLAWIATGNQWDLSRIEFDFTPTADNVQFDFVFGSEEYCEYVGTQFNDVFGFFISGPGIVGNENIGLIPGTSIPVTINNVNHQTYSSFYVNNNDYQPCQNLPVQAPNDCQLDGWTAVFTATAQVIPCSTYHIKLVIADVSDAFYDSAVFLKANSFSAGGTVHAEPVYAGGQASAYENCGANYIKFSRGTGGNSQPVEINFTASAASTATAGVDYAPLSSPVIIPAGQNEVLVPVSIFADGLTEGQESIVLLVDDLCSCTQGTVTFLIGDNSPLSIQLDDVTTCSGVPVTLAPVVSGGAPPYTYLWNTGETTATITATSSGAYSVAVGDVCNPLQTGSAFVLLDTLVQISDTLAFCPGGSVTIGDSTYTQPTTVLDTIAGNGNGCDTLIVYSLQLLPYETLTHTIGLCPTAAITIGGIAYTAPNTVTDTLPGVGDACDTIATYVLELLPNPTLAQTIPFCAGSSVTIGDSTYTQPTTVVAVLPGQNGACDTLATYELELLPEITRTETAALCPGETVTIAGTVYTAPATVMVTIPGAGGACDTLVTHVLDLLPLQQIAETRALCPGETITLDGVAYAAPDTVTITLPGAGDDCDTIATYVLNLLPQPVLFDTIRFCPGDSVEIGGVFYHTPGSVTLTLPGAGDACDTLVTYTLQSRTPAPSLVKINCPPSVGLTIPAGNTGETVTFNPASASTDCVCPGLSLAQSAGLASGSTFPVGVSQVCYTAEDSCGNSASCCFTITIEEAEPCDIKQIGCMKWELLTITQNAEFEKTYRIRVTNFCPNPMTYTSIQLPNGTVAVSPPNGSIYAAPSGRSYEVRNPSTTGFWSIRFKSINDSIASGQSDIFKYTLPTQSTPAYIHVGTRLEPRLWFESHLNTFHCPVGITPPDLQAPVGGLLRVFPNPTSGLLSADLSAWAGERVQVRVLDGRGRALLDFAVTAGAAPQAILLPEKLADGIYFLDALAGNGAKETVRFVLQR